MTSVVIAAHNEETVLGAALVALLQERPRPVIVVSANGCTDATADVARRYGVTVVERREPGKADALNAGDAVASGFPRVYLDADIVPPRDALALMTAALATRPGVLAAVPRRRVEVAGRPWAVRAYIAVNSRLPANRTGLFGRGMIMLAEGGRARFEKFPDFVADDLYLDALFGEGERVVVDAVEVVVEAPHTVKDLMDRLARVRRGNHELRAAMAQLGIGVRPSARWAWLRDVVLPQPWLAPAAVPYVVITLMADRRGRRGGTSWGRDDSTRRPSVAGGAR